MDAIILCGGRGTRLASVVSDVPKPLAMVKNKPFLTYLLDYLSKYPQIDRVIFATGYLSEKIEKFYGDKYKNINLKYSVEKEALGTGGAVLKILKNFNLSSYFYILNGDSFSNINLNNMESLYFKYNQECMIIGSVEVSNSSRYGLLEIEGDRLINFHEKNNVDKFGIINSGIYLANNIIFNQWKDEFKNISLERDIFPILAINKKIIISKNNCPFIDIGLPETYKISQDFFDNI
jgi:D-glycero-alpha-D-manno-heptose 1-phosphate guanylyltransferase